MGSVRQNRADKKYIEDNQRFQVERGTPMALWRHDSCIFVIVLHLTFPLITDSVLGSNILPALYVLYSYSASALMILTIEAHNGDGECSVSDEKQ